MTLATPHSRQRGLIRDVINPQDGRILCDRNPVICGFSLRIQASSRIANSTISRPREMLVAFIEATLLGEPCFEPYFDRSLNPRADLAELIDFARSLKSLRWQNFRWTGLGQKT